MNINRLRMLIFLHLSRLPLRSRGWRPFVLSLAGVQFENYAATFIGEGVIFDTNYPDDIYLEEGVRITARCIILSHFKESESGNVYSRGKIHIKKRAYIGCNTVICKPVTIGEDAIVGASSVVTKDIPAGEVWAGNPARFIRKRTPEE